MIDRRTANESRSRICYRTCMTTPLESTTEMLEVEHLDRILTIRLNRPDALNSFRPEMLTGIAELVSAAESRSDVAVIVLEGAGRAFSAGVDLRVLQGIAPKAGKIGDVFDAPARRAYSAMRSSSVPRSRTLRRGSPNSRLGLTQVGGAV